MWKVIRLFLAWDMTISGFIIIFKLSNSYTNNSSLFFHQTDLESFLILFLISFIYLCYFYINLIRDFMTLRDAKKQLVENMSNSLSYADALTEQEYFKNQINNERRLVKLKKEQSEADNLDLLRKQKEYQLVEMKVKIQQDRMNAEKKRQLQQQEIEIERLKVEQKRIETELQKAYAEREKKDIYSA